MKLNHMSTFSGKGQIETLLLIKSNPKPTVSEKLERLGLVFTLREKVKGYS